jgi:hypothetical protein
MLFEYRSDFEFFLKRFDYQMTLETFIEKSMKVNEFSNELNIFATSIAINRPIYSFGGMKMELYIQQNTNWNHISLKNH